MIRRLLEWLFPFLKVERLLVRARAHGRVTLQETDLGDGIGWTCSIRPPVPPSNETSHVRTTIKKHQERYAWTGASLSLREAISIALEEADENPVMRRLDGISYAPKLSAKEFDE